jgi:general secretion pathway protein G
MKMRFHPGFARRVADGMTLLEVMVVVIILGMLATIVGKVVLDRMEDARVNAAKAQIAQFMGALDLFYLDNGFYPTTEQGLKALVEKPTAGPSADKWGQRKYLDSESIPLDPWGHEYFYQCPGTHGRFDIICYGRDGVEGGEGYDADIHSWELGGARKDQ